MSTIIWIVIAFAVVCAVWIGWELKNAPVIDEKNKDAEKDYDDDWFNKNKLSF